MPSVQTFFVQDFTLNEYVSCSIVMHFLNITCRKLLSLVFYCILNVVYCMCSFFSSIVAIIVYMYYRLDVILFQHL